MAVSPCERSPRRPSRQSSPPTQRPVIPGPDEPSLASFCARACGQSRPFRFRSYFPFCSLSQAACRGRLPIRSSLWRIALRRCIPRPRITESEAHWKPGGFGLAAPLRLRPFQPLDPGQEVPITGCIARRGEQEGAADLALTIHVNAGQHGRILDRRRRWRKTIGKCGRPGGGESQTRGQKGSPISYPSHRPTPSPPPGRGSRRSSASRRRSPGPWGWRFRSA